MRILRIGHWFGSPADICIHCRSFELPLNGKHCLTLIQKRSTTFGASPPISMQPLHNPPPSYGQQHCFKYGCYCRPLPSFSFCSIFFFLYSGVLVKLAKRWIHDPPLTRICLSLVRAADSPHSCIPGTWYVVFLKFISNLDKVLHKGGSVPDV